jgi:hypothetical protein
VYVVPIASDDHVSVGDCPTLVDPLAGDGLEGASGGPAVPLVVKDQIDDDATSEGFTTVAFVRETIFQKYVVPGCS